MTTNYVAKAVQKMNAGTFAPRNFCSWEQTFLFPCLHSTYTTLHYILTGTILTSTIPTVPILTCHDP